MKAVIILLLIGLFVLLLSSCGPKAHNCEWKAKQMKRAHKDNVAQFAHYVKR